MKKKLWTVYAVVMAVLLGATAHLSAVDLDVTISLTSGQAAKFQQFLDAVHPKRDLDPDPAVTNLETNAQQAERVCSNLLYQTMRSQYRAWKKTQVADTELD